MLKMLGIIMVFGSCSTYGMYKKLQFSRRVKSLESMIYAIKIMQRELSFNCPKTCELIKILSKEMPYPLCEIFRQMYKIIKIDDNLSIEYKWSKIFRENQENAYFLPNDTEIIINMASLLGKFDVSEQIKSLNYYKNLLSHNLAEAKIQSQNEGNITRAVAVSVGMIIAIILI